MPGGRPMGRRHQDDVRAKIQASQLINYLQNHALTGQGSDNAQTRVRAALGLLNKTLPDVTRSEITGPDGGKVIARIEQVIVDPKP